MKKKITLIAEIGENYLGNISFAKKLINEAKKSGADYAKFQSYNELCLKKSDPEYNWFKKVSLTDKNHLTLKQHCKKKNIQFLSSPFSIERAKFLCEKLNMQTIKVASCKMYEKNILKYLNQKCKKIFLSTGMATIKEIKDSLKYLINPEVVIMHCVSEYPLPEKNANLLAIKVLQKNFPKNQIGYSDHTIGVVASLTAVALGATVIEKHFTLNKKLEGTDHILSADSMDLKQISSEVKKISSLLGMEVKKPTKNENKIKSFMRKRFII